MKKDSKNCKIEVPTATASMKSNVIGMNKTNNFYPKPDIEIAIDAWTLEGFVKDKIPMMLFQLQSKDGQQILLGVKKENENV